MTNNDILRRVRYMHYFSDPKIVMLLKLAGHKVEAQEVNAWLKKEDDPKSVEMTDKELAFFLNGLIIEKRGKREGPLPEAEDPLTNNMILRKMKIAYNLTSDDILDLYASIDKAITKSELSDFMRNANHKFYRECKDQYLRNFLNALQEKLSKKAE